MIPPITRGNVSRDVPVTAWEQLRAFDTARRCEEGRVKFVGRSAALEAEMRKSSPHDSNEVSRSEAQHDRARAGRCVPAEYIYPPREELRLRELQVSN